MVDWSSVFYSAIGGGGGAALGALAAATVVKILGKNPADKDDKTVSGIRGGLAAVGAVLGYSSMTGLYKNMTLPRIFPMDMSSLYEELPFLVELEKQDPESFNRLVQTADSFRGGTPSQKHLDTFRAEYMFIIDEKSKTASIGILREMNAVAEMQFELLEQSDPRICTMISNGLSYPTLDKILGKEYAEKEKAVLLRLFAEPPRSSDVVVDV